MVSYEQDKNVKQLKRRNRERVGYKGEREDGEEFYQM